jgi:hypothetical protein
VKDKSTANGAIVHMWTCQAPGDTSVNERWTYNPTTRALSVYGGTKCLQATGTAAGSGMVIWDCTGASNQQWSMNDDRTITSLQSGLALEVKDAATANGTSLILNSHTGATHQQWSRPSERSSALHALGADAGMCLNLPSQALGTQTTIATCTRSAAQQWTYHALTQRFTIYTGPTKYGDTFCLGADAAGTKAVSAFCGTDPSTQWRLVRGDDGVSGVVENVASGRCLSLTATSAGTGVALQDCASFAANPTLWSYQQWVWGP